MIRNAFYTTLAVALTTTLCLTTAAQAAVWNAGTGNWEDAANWTPNDIPDLIAEDATIDNGGEVDYGLVPYLTLEINANQLQNDKIITVVSTAGASVGSIVTGGSLIKGGETIKTIIDATTVELTKGLNADAVPTDTFDANHDEVSINDLTIGSGSTLNINGDARKLYVTGDLNNAGDINTASASGGNGYLIELIYTGTNLTNTGRLYAPIDTGSNNRSTGFTLATGNTNAGTIDMHAISDSQDDIRSKSRLTIDGSGTFTNTGTVSIMTSYTDTTLGAQGNRAGALGQNATYAQTSATAVTDVTAAGSPEFAWFEASQINIDAGTLSGTGQIVATAGGNALRIGDGAGDGAVLSPGASVGTLHIGKKTQLFPDDQEPTSNTRWVFYEPRDGNTTLNRGEGFAITPTDVLIDSDGTYAVEIDGDVADLLAIFGNLTFNPGATISVTQLTAPTLSEYQIVDILNDADFLGTGPTSHVIGDALLAGLGGPDGGNWQLELRDGNTELWLTQVPEPATLALLGVGGMALLRRRRRA